LLHRKTYDRRQTITYTEAARSPGRSMGGGMRRCRAIRADGGRCQRSGGQFDYCFVHDPAREAEREDANARAADAARRHKERLRRRRVTGDDRAD